jgi:hypothetical protein
LAYALYLDAAKHARNIRERGLDFTDAKTLFDRPMLVNQDTRQDYGEVRQIGFGSVQGRVMVVVFTERPPDMIRIISFRKANSREQARYTKALTDRLGESGRHDG